VIDARGLVVAPGFINVHGHEGLLPKTMEVSVRDGVTTIIGGNCGFSSTPMGGEFMGADDYFAKVVADGAHSNFATLTGHNSLRATVGVPDPYTGATADQVEAMLVLLEKDLAAGSLGVSYGPFYNPGTTYEEMLATATMAAENDGGASIHVRHGSPIRPSPDQEPLNIQAFREGIRIARESGVPMIMSHNGGPNFGAVNSGMALQIMNTAMGEGLRLISDVHPYDAFNTSAAAPVFQDSEPIAEQLALLDRSISDITVQNTVVVDGEVFMESLEPFESIEQFIFVRDRVRAGDLPDPGLIGHFYPDHMIKTWMQAPFVMMESDGAVEVDPETGKFTAHPRIAGTYSKFLGHWVREQGVCDLMTALAKSSTMAAVFLGLDGKGRVQVGADADLVVFDPGSIIDTATYRGDESLNPPVGIPHVIVNGVPVVRDGELTGETPGSIIRRERSVPGELIDLGILPGYGVAALAGAGG
jgi:N-acyl-D-amino-acid deacylase